MKTKVMVFLLAVALLSSTAAWAKQRICECLPDLVVDSMIWEYADQRASSKEPVQGDKVRIKVVIANIGQKDSGPFSTQLEVKSPSIGGVRNQTKKLYQKSPSIPPYKYQTVYFYLGKVIKGTYTMSAWVDPDNKIAEFRDNNNQKYGGADFGVLYGPPAQGPDLVVSLSSPDTSRHIGRKVLIRAKVENQGTKASGSSYLLFQCQGKRDERKKVGALQPGKSANFEFHHRWSTRGKRTCKATVDANRQVREANETNNVDRLQVNIK